MKERATILTEAARLRQMKHPYALATVVKVNGSAYRRPGARMLITPNGSTHGTISGGCLEREVARQALRMMETQASPTVQAFDLSDDDLILGFGTGCDGVVHVLIEPAPKPHHTDPLALLQTCYDHRHTGLLATVINAPEGSGALGRRLLYRADGTAGGDLADGPLHELLRADLAAILADQRHQIRRYDTAAGTFEVLFEMIRPPVHLALFGAGHDVHPMVHLARTLGWRVTVVGRKPVNVLTERFPDADAHIFLMHPEEAPDHVAFDAWSAAVVMNHQYPRDKTLIGALLGTSAAYVGALGPRVRTARIRQELAAEQPALTEAHFDKLHGPIGLDIGTETPDEIALATLAEIQAVLHGRTGGKLRNTPGRIHEPVPIR